MKKKLNFDRSSFKHTFIFTLFFILISGLPAAAQGGGRKVEVRVRSVAFLPGAQVLLPSALQQVYTHHNVTGYEQKYPMAAEFNHVLSGGLTRVYDLTCNCDPEQLKSALEAFVPTYFENVYPASTIELLDSPPYMTNDPEDAAWNMWRINDINGQEAWDITHGDPGIIIAITDTGYDLDHEDLVNKIIYVDPGVNTTGSHGTSVAFCAAGDTDNGLGHSSIGFNCSLMLFPTGYTAIMNAALKGAHVINCSWIGSCAFNQNSHDIIKMVTDMGVMIVAGAGNGTIGANCGGTGNNNPVYPASYPEVISVSGSGPYGCLEFGQGCWGAVYDPPAHFTHNPLVDVIAPGMCLRTAIPGDNYDVGSGTSFSSPIVAGVIGLMLSVDPCMTPAEVMQAITSTDQDIYNDQMMCSGLNAPLEPLMPGVGLVDAQASVQIADAGGQEYHIQAGQVVIWDNQTIEAKDIYVHSGGTLIMRNGTVVYMKKGKSIIVEREAKLYVDHSTITAGCSKAVANWRGIFVHGNATLPQPNLSINSPQAALSYTFSAGESGVVVLVNGARLENARYGISTSAPGYGYDPGQVSRWGGLVLVNDATFYNVVQGIEFMRYDLDNKSRVRNSLFTKSDDYGVNVTGITVWDCRGLEFSGNTFEKMDYSGIGGIDFSANIVNDNSFEDCRYGVEVQSTSGHASTVAIRDNYFDRNDTHVYSAGTSQSYGLQVTNNEFFTSAKYGVRLEGPSTYRLEDNAFFGNTLAGVAAVNTVDEFSFVRSNRLGQGDKGLQFLGNNRRTQFLSNCFLMTSADVSLEQFGSSKGWVRNFQGNTGFPAGNCFTTGIEHIHAVPAETFSFSYFIPQGGEPTQDDCEGVIVPAVNGNNFSVLNASVNSYDGCGLFITENDNYTFTDLYNVRNEKAALYQQMLGGPSTPLLLFQYEAKEAQEDRIEAYLEREAIAVRNYDRAESIYAGQTSRDAQESLYGLKVKRRQFAQARSLLNSMSTGTPDELLFAQIQSINLDRWEQPGYTLTTANRDFLYNTAMSESSVRAYAGALYFLLTGERAIPDLQRRGAPRQQEQPLEVASKSQYALYPVPSSTSLTLQLPPGDDRPGQAELRDLTGTPVLVQSFSAPIGNELSIRVEHLPRGIFFLTVRRAGQPVYSTKVILQGE